MNLVSDLHYQFIVSESEKKDTLEYWFSEYLRLSGVYWGLTSLELLGRSGHFGREETLEMVQKCEHKNGGYGGNAHHDPHLLYTLSAVQIVALMDDLGQIDTEKTASYVSSLQQSDGSFVGDEWGEGPDTRFTYCAVACLAILGKLDMIDREKAIDYVISCWNQDGGFGCDSEGESHGGQVFTCIGALSILGGLDRVDYNKVGRWCAARQTACGGLNGRPEKLQDVCYSWWIYSAMCIIGKGHWISQAKLKEFILSCQDTEDGGIADRKGDMADIFHTFFGLAGLSLMKCGDLQKICPTYALPERVVRRLELPRSFVPK